MYQVAKPPIGEVTTNILVLSSTFPITAKLILLFQDFEQKMEDFAEVNELEPYRKKRTLQLPVLLKGVLFEEQIDLEVSQEITKLHL